MMRGWIPPWQQELKWKYSHSSGSMAIFHCMFIERSLRRKRVFHSILFRYSTMVAVLGCGHSCLTVVCSCVWFSWGGLYESVALDPRSSQARLASRLCSGAIGSGREGGRINADKKFSSGWIQVGWCVSISFQFRTIHLPRSQSSCTCPLVNSMRCLFFPDWKGAADC